MKKIITVLSTSIILGIGSISFLPAAQAEETGLKGIQEERTGIQTEIMKTDQEIFQVQDELAKLSEQIKRANQAIIDNNNMITQTEVKVQASEKEVYGLEQEITLIRDRIDKRNQLLKKRALALQENGGNVKYINVILGSDSFGDFVGRLHAVASIVQADQDLVKQYEEDQKEVVNKQAKVEKKLSDLKAMKIELEGMQAQILEQKEENDVLQEEWKQKEQEKLSQKEKLQQLDQSLALKEGEIGAENTNSLTPNSTPINAAIPSTTNEAINIVIHAGEKYIGNSVYVFGGGRNAYDVSQGRFDCSGFVAWAFAQARIKVGAHTDILKNLGKRVSFSEARPGDLVFFDTYKIDGHVGIYLGNGKFIGSQSRTGIAIADMTNGYYLKKFNGRVIRIINN
ncbi:NlpC/P60 family protein [Neobacillus drentensis]|uniref:coiled-coil domain-containing protein n=1 Tax=Neobacillus drentensis TaxID=220684 RepID=UPI001F3D7F22|nr:C40 family peptidase [Neobacillus drentensis]ULT58367.1 NlpC/P60 family protein [Neobacillus drentensis]